MKLISTSPKASIASPPRPRLPCRFGAKIPAPRPVSPASAGVSYNKFLAKMASGERKPDGLFVITPAMGAAFVESMPVGKFHGIGPVTTARMERLGIRCGRDLKAHTLPFLVKQFGKAGPYYYGLARGVDERPVCADRVRKSIGAENTFIADLFTVEESRAAAQARLLRRYGVTMRKRQFADGRSRSRPNTQTSSRSPAAEPARRP